MGEFGLIDRIARIAGTSDDGLVAGIGDDAAVIDEPGQEYLLVTVDMLVEGVHFPPNAEATGLGRRALAVNISDIAAMGGHPQFALTSLALSPATPVAWVESLFDGVKAEAVEFGLSVAGGNLTRTSGPSCLDVVLLGRVPKDELIRRSGARAGDLLAVTGCLGAAAAELLPSGGQERAARTAPAPRVAAGRALAKGKLAHAMIDLSDGLSADVMHLANASGVGAVILAKQIPVCPTAGRRAREAGIDPISLALNGGEDYELLFAAAEEDWDRIVEACGDVPVHRIGLVTTARTGVLLQGSDGGRTPLRPAGWTHF